MVFSHTLLYSYVYTVTNSRNRFPGVTDRDEVSKQFTEIIPKEKDIGLVGHTQPATDTNDATLDNGTLDN